MKTRTVLEPIVVAIVTGLVIARVWGSLHEQVSLFHDEAAYLLQARLFASGRWVAAARPIPEFFEQYHVLVSPYLAAKYWPGHSLLLVPGVWLGLPNLVPVLLSAATGGMLFALTRSLVSLRVGLLTWLIWITSRGALFFQPTYMSEVTTGFLWLLGWWAFQKWRFTRRSWFALVLSLCVAWGSLTRPLTMLAFAIPITVVAAVDLRRRPAWGDLSLGLAIMAGVFSLIPLWNVHTIGDWRRTPYAQYNADYFPFDKLGFGVDSTPPRRTLPPDMAAFTRKIKPAFQDHTIVSLPRLATVRLKAIGRDMWEGPRWVLIPFAVIGLFLAPGPVLIALATGTLLFVFHLFYGFISTWTVYYLETLPVLALLSAIGLSKVAQLAGRVLGPRTLRIVRIPLAIVCGGAALLYSLARVERAHDVRRYMALPKTHFAEAIDTLSAPAVVFVRYASGHDVDRTLIENVPDLAVTRVWVAHDRGRKNRDLMALAPGRIALIYDEASRKLLPFRDADP